MSQRSLLMTKMSGAGNDFVIVDARLPEKIEILKTLFPNQMRSEIAQKICRQSKDLKADGMVFVKPATTGQADFAWDFFNADGSVAEMCGNAARCVAVYAQTHNICQSPMTFETGAGLISAVVHNPHSVTVTTTEISLEKWQQSAVLSNGQKVNFDLIVAGVPHAIIPWSSEQPLSAYKELAKELRRHSVLGPQGANVTLVREESLDVVHSASFERGVEDFTLACGTGAVAAAFWYVKSHPRSSQKITVHVPGGQLHVDLTSQRPRLTGPVRVIVEQKIFAQD